MTTYSYSLSADFIVDNSACAETLATEIEAEGGITTDLDFINVSLPTPDNSPLSLAPAAPAHHPAPATPPGAPLQFPPHRIT